MLYKQGKKTAVMGVKERDPESQAIISSCSERCIEQDGFYDLQASVY